MILTLFVGKSLSLARAYLPILFEVALIADKDDSYFFICVVPHLLQPLPDGFEGGAP